MKSILLRGRAFRLALVAATTALLIGAIMGGISLAQGLGGSDDNNTGQVKSSEASGSTAFAPINVTVQVDQTVCATGAVQCSGTGEEALPTNSSPVRLGIQVQRKRGKPVTGLTTSAFEIDNDFVPAGGTMVVRATCDNCFQSGSGGVYVIYVNPTNDANWKSGSYFVQVQVTVPTPNGNKTHYALAQIEIPFV